jgi:hypothetical protein
VTDTFRELAREVSSLLSRGMEAGAGEEGFNRLALRIFRFQARVNPVYGRFVAGRGVDPREVDDWRAIPAVPTRAFKYLDILSVDDSVDDEDVRVFRTSGTREGSARRGRHLVPDPGLYRASLLPPFRAHLLPDGRRLPIHALLPPTRERPDSSLSTMVEVAMEELGGPESDWYVGVDGGIREEALRRTLADAEADGNPLLLVGTAFSWVHWMDAMDREGWRFALPEGSRLLETGGFKGRSRSLARDALYGGLADRLGIPVGRIVNEYGMTELLSQFYEPVLLGDGPCAGEGETLAKRLDRRALVGPPWVRTRVLDPDTLEERPAGREGILCHLDLANLGSAIHILTEDLGVAVGGRGFRVLGRAPGAEPRGCSRAMDDLLGGGW